MPIPLSLQEQEHHSIKFSICFSRNMEWIKLENSLPNTSALMIQHQSTPISTRLSHAFLPAHDGIPQIVTTNFDHLFEHAFDGGQIRYYEPPSFPDLRHGVPLTASLTCMGGSQEKKKVHNDYVLSSSDFGRAYLAGGLGNVLYPIFA